VALDRRFPFAEAYENDNSGWQIVSDRPVTRCLVALDASVAAVKRALDSEAELIVTHHPLYYPHIHTLDPQTLNGAVTKALLTADIGLIACHTCADRQPHGVSGALADLLKLENRSILAPDEEGAFYKLVTFVPDASASDLRSALAAAGAGTIGNYEECSFTLAGTGSYRPMGGARPLVGEIGRLEEVNEIRLEMRVAEDRIDKVLQALRRNHPYDEVACDLFRTWGQGGDLGIGILGSLPEAEEIATLLGRIKDVLGGVPLIVTGPEEGLVERVAVAGGSTAGFISLAAARGAQIFVGGDLKYHPRLEVAEELVCVDAGHRATEQPGVRRLAETLEHAAASHDWSMAVELFLEDPAPGRIL